MGEYMKLTPEVALLREILGELKTLNESINTLILQGQEANLKSSSKN